MPLSRRKAITVLAASATVVATQGLPALADERPPMAFSAHSYGLESLGRLELYLRAFYSPITRIRAHLISKVDGTEAGLVEEFVHYSNDPADGYWLTKDPILLPALGYYQVDVEIWTAGGAYAYQHNVNGEFTYLALTTISDLQFTPERPTPDHRFITVTGQLLAKHPGTLALTPVSEGKVQLEVVNRYTAVATSGADGHFTIDLPIDGQTAVGVTPEADPNAYRLADRPVWRLIEPEPGPSRITLTTSPDAADLGLPVTLSGVLEVAQSDNWVPLANRKVHLSSFGVELAVSPVTTDAQGRFSASILLSHSAGVRADFYPYDADDDYIAAAQATIAVNVRRPIAFDDYFAVRHSLDPKKPTFWDVTGYLKDASLPGHVQIQSSASPAGPWTTTGLAKFTGVQSSAGYEFKSEIEIFSRCYVRAYSPATSHTQPAASKAVFVVGAPAPRRTPVGGGQPIPRRG